MKDAEVIKYALDRIGGRWKSMIVWELKHGPKRFSDLKTDISGITQKMLTSSLVEMQADGLLVRKSFPQIPPRVEYTLTALGESMLPISAAFFEWGALNQGMEVSPSNWEKKESKSEIEIPVTESAIESVVSEIEGTNLDLDKITEEIKAPEEEAIESTAETVKEESVENDPWFFAPMPQKNVAKKKTSKKSSGSDPGTQQLGLFFSPDLER